MPGGEDNEGDQLHHNVRPIQFTDRSKHELLVNPPQFESLTLRKTKGKGHTLGGFMQPKSTLKSSIYT